MKLPPPRSLPSVRRGFVRLGLVLHLVLVLALAVPGRAQEAEAGHGAPVGPQVSLGRPGHGRPVAGLGRAFHAGRRAELMERVGEGVLLFRGLPETRGYTTFRQDKTFWYLTGVESPNATLVLDAGTGREVLFLPARSRFGERWEGEKWDASDEWVVELTGVDEVRPSDELMDFLAEVLAGRGEIATSSHPHVTMGGCHDRAKPHDDHQAEDPLDGRNSREAALARQLTQRFGVEVKDVAPILTEMRRIKQPEEVAAMRRAAHAGSLAMAEAIRSTRPGIGEWDLDALMSFVQVHEGADGLAYHAIVGSGPNSCVLHYNHSSRRMQAGDVLLIDYGPELDHYTTDITRTWPVDGRFSERAAELYDVVLEAQEAGIAAVRPGVTMRDIDAVCNAVFAKHGLERFRMHGPCHYIGMEVHDPGGYDTPLEPGVTITVEPGLYETATGIGIRIEDVVLVTKHGCEVLSAGVTKDRAELEALVAERGILDWMSGEDD